MPANGDDPTFFYGKLGYTFEQPIGATSISVDYGVFDNAAVFDIGQEATGYGLQFVQELADWNTQLYAGCRTLSLEDDTAADYEDVTVVMAGARFSF
jgi:hypothetical protein